VPQKKSAEVELPWEEINIPSTGASQPLPHSSTSSSRLTPHPDMSPERRPTVREYGLLGVTKQKIITRKEFYWKHVICYYTHCTETMY
jgi:hypothetical protein